MMQYFVILFVLFIVSAQNFVEEQEDVSQLEMDGFFDKVKSGMSKAKSVYSKVSKNEHVSKGIRILSKAARDSTFFSGIIAAVSHAFKTQTTAYKPPPPFPTGPFDLSLCPNKCSGNGKCIADKTKTTKSPSGAIETHPFVCQCDKGWSGEACSLKIDALLAWIISHGKTDFPPCCNICDSQKRVPREFFDIPLYQGPSDDSNCLVSGARCGPRQRHSPQRTFFIQVSEQLGKNRQELDVSEEGFFDALKSTASSAMKMVGSILVGSKSGLQGFTPPPCCVFCGDQRDLLGSSVDPQSSRTTSFIETRTKVRHKRRKKVSRKGKSERSKFIFKKSSNPPPNTCCTVCPIDPELKLSLENAEEPNPRRVLVSKCCDFCPSQFYTPWQSGGYADQSTPSSPFD